MARTWLEVTTDEVHSRLGANERLAERRESMAERAWALIDDLISPAFQDAAQRIGQREFRMGGDSDWAVARCGIYAPGDVESDPRVAFHEAEFDAYQPLVILRSKADGAGSPVHSRTLHIDNVDADVIEAFLSR